MLERAALLIDFDMSAHWPRTLTLMQRYPRMDVAQAAWSRAEAYWGGLFCESPQ